MRSDRGGEARRIITPPPAPITPGLLATGVTFDYKRLSDLKRKKNLAMRCDLFLAKLRREK